MILNNIERPTLLVVVGPTGSGKSDFAVKLALRFGAPILSTDSRQLYRGMAIGTAQPTESQLLAVPHYFIADRQPTERFSCADFEREALARLDQLFRKHNIVIAVGGSGLYIDALCNGLDPLPDVDMDLRKQLSDRILRDGLEPLLEILRERDPATYERIDRRNPARVQRAVEILLTTNQPPSNQRTNSRTERPFDIVKLGIDRPREELYARIDARVDAMMAAGLEQEARALFPLRHLTALQTVGYSELFDHFEGLYTAPDGQPLTPEQSLARAVELIKRNSRRYAKRQMTWFRRDGAIRWLTAAEIDDVNLI